MLNFCFKSIIFAAALATVTGTVAIAETTGSTAKVNFVQNADGEVRVNIAGKLRMLSQRIPAAACNLHAGISPVESRAALDAAVKEFDSILYALEFGDTEIGVLSSETSLRTQRMISDLGDIFTPLKSAIDADADPALSEATVRLLADRNMDVLDSAIQLVSRVSGQYLNPAALLQSDAMAIDIAGRQRMLTQKMSKEVCQVMSGLDAPASVEALAGTMSMFEASLGALREGMDQAGIQPPPNEDIVRGLEIVQFDWGMVRGNVAYVIEGGMLDNDSRSEVFLGLNKTLVDMNTVVGMYSEAAKLGL